MDQNTRYEQEFIRLFNSFRAPVHAYIQTVTGDHHVAEELTQELFMKLWQKREKWEAIENMDHYIMRMAHNASMDWFKKLALDARLIREVKARLQVENNNVEDHLAYREATQLLKNALDTLSPQRRKVFDLSRNEGLRLGEIADVMGISFHTANHHLRAALTHIREYFLTHVKDKALIILLLTLIS